MAANFHNQNNLPDVSFSTTPADKRRHPRVETCLTATWQGMSSRSSVRISDLSEGACYVDSIAKVLVGELMTLNISGSSQKSFEVSCVVAHYSRLGFGVRFVDLDEARYAQIRLLIEND